MSTFALSLEYTRTIPAKFVTKHDGSPMRCVTCGTTLVLGAAFAATDGTGWHSYCDRCASSTVAQVAGLVARIETVVADLNPIPTDILDAVAAVTPAIEAILAPKANPTPGEFLVTKRELLNIRSSIGAAKTAAAGPVIRTNGYGGKCGTCGVYVAPQAGRIEKVGGRWVTYHLDGACPAPGTAPAGVDVEPGLYLFDDGSVRKVYTTRNDRTAAKVLVPSRDGNSGSFQYAPGGVRLVRNALDAGTAHLMTQEEAAIYGRNFSFCVNCGLHLDDDRSLAAGYGETCARNKGWFYPSYTEAGTILGRPAAPRSKPAPKVAPVWKPGSGMFKS